MSTELSPIPPGAMLEIGVELIDEGSFIKSCNAALRKCFRDLIAFEKETGNRTGKAAVSIKISLGRMKQADGRFIVDTDIKVTVPTPRKATVVVEKAGRLLCQPVGTNNDPLQQMIFDSQGRIIAGGGGVIDGKTGEVVDDAPPVAGVIRRAANS